MEKEALVYLRGHQTKKSTIDTKKPATFSGLLILTNYYLAHMH